MASDTDAPTDVSEKNDDWMYAIARHFGLQDRDGRGLPPRMSPGDRAALRRMYLTRSQTADGAVIKLLAAAKVPEYRQIRDFDRWRLIAHAAAMLSGTGKLRAHASNRKLGKALQDAKYSENRLLRLLAVRGEALHDQVRRAIRVVAQKGEQPVNLWTLYHLLSANPDRAEAARIRIAQDYYAAEARSKEGTSSDD